MKGFAAVFLLLLGCVVCSKAQEASFSFDPKVSYSTFVVYSGDSSHILLGQADDRHLLEVGAGYSRRLHEGNAFSWRYQIEVTPLVMLRNPLQTMTVTNTPIGTSGQVDAGTFQYAQLVQKQCVAGTGSGYYYGGQTGTAVVGSYTYKSVCTNPWTYGGGVSPLGQKINLRPFARWQPYVAANAGFVTFRGVVPSSGATKFNFSFEFGGGVEWNSRPGRTWGLDFRYHHISNAGRGMENPGVDNAAVKLTYSFGR
jgi:hypothetical protein